MVRMDETSPDIGPGTYDTKQQKNEVIVKPVNGNKLPSNLTISQKATVNKPGFGHITAARPDDIRKWDTGFVTHNPGPSHYDNA